MNPKPMIGWGLFIVLGLIHRLDSVSSSAC